jgi:hypothetical protein
VSPRLEAAVDRALAKDPGRRFPSMAAFAKELRACLAEVEGDPVPPPEEDLAMTLVTRPGPAPARAPRRPSYPRRSRRRRPVGWVLLALLAGGATLAAVLLLSGSGHHKAGPGGGGPSGSAVQLHGVGDYVPSGSPDTHADTASAATDGDPNTPWITQLYNSSDFGGLLPEGLGLVLDAGSSVTLAQLTVSTPTSGSGFTAHIGVGDSQSGPFVTDSSSRTVSGRTTFTLEGKSGQYYVIWITQLAPTGHAEIAEVTAKS